MTMLVAVVEVVEVVVVVAAAALMMLILQCVLIEVLTRMAEEMKVEQEEQKKTESTKRPERSVVPTLLEFPPAPRSISSVPASTLYCSRSFSCRPHERYSLPPLECRG